MKKYSPSLIVAVVVAFFIFPLIGAAHAAGPVSKLYLTAPSQNMNWVVQGSSVVTSWSQQYGGESPLAVNNTVRTIGSAPGQNGAEYTLAGSFTGVTYSNTTSATLFDGTTDGTLNYSVNFVTGDVYSFNSDWTNPTLLFSLGSEYDGIAYDPCDNTLWLANTFSDRIEHRSLFGTLMSSFPLPFTTVTFLALDPADNTLWMGSLGNEGTFYQFAKNGTQRGTVSYPALAGQNTLGGEFRFCPTGLRPEINGQGAIKGPSGKKAEFAFLDVEDEQVTKNFLEGILAYEDKAAKLNFQTGKITSVLASGNEAEIQGTASIGSGKKKQTLNFTINVLANQNPSTNDTYSISLSNGYSASGNLVNGFISIELGD